MPFFVQGIDCADFRRILAWAPRQGAQACPGRGRSGLTVCNGPGGAVAYGGVSSAPRPGRAALESCNAGQFVPPRRGGRGMETGCRRWLPLPGSHLRLPHFCPSRATPCSPPGCMERESLCLMDFPADPCLLDRVIPRYVTAVCVVCILCVLWRAPEGASSRSSNLIFPERKPAFLKNIAFGKRAG